MTKKSFLHLLTKEISGDISRDEQQLLNESLKENDVFGQVHSEIHRFMASENNRANVNVEAKLNEVWQRIHTLQDDIALPETSSETPPKHIVPMWARVAASIAIILSIGYFGYRAVTPQNLYTEIIAAADENLFATLDDGTQVWIGKHSQIAYNKHFGAKHRKIRLTGEAFFEVAHNADVPLTVSANEVDVMVKGTAFNVNATQADVEVVLLRGLVAVKDNRRKNTEEVLLHPHQKIVLRDGKALANDSNYVIREMVHTNDTILPETRWMNGALVFQKQKFIDLAKLMESRFGVTIEIQNPKLREQRFTGSIKNEGLSQMLDALKQSYPFTYEVKNNAVTIK